MDKHPQQAFTIIELMVVVAVLAVLALIAAPSLKDYMLVQRLKGINAQLVTDMQFARSEAVARNTWLRVSFKSYAAMSCYSLYTATSNSGRCDCRRGVGTACDANATEVRTVQVPTSQSVTVKPAGQDTSFAFDNVTGSIYSIPTDNPSAAMDSFQVLTSIDPSRTLRTTVGRSGRLTVCSSNANLGAPSC